MSKEPEPESDDKACITMLLAAAIFAAISVSFVASCQKEREFQQGQTERLKIEKGLK